MDILFNLCLSVMICSTLIGVYHYKRFNSPLRWILFATAFAILTEIIGAWAKNKYGDNRIVFSLANPLETALYVGFFICIIPQKTVQWISATIALYVFLASLVNIFLIKQAPIPFFYFIILKGIIITMLCIIYLYNLFALDYGLKKVDVITLIIITGMLFYYSFSTVYFSVLNYIIKHNIQLFFMLQLKPYLYIIYMVFQGAILFTFVKASIKKKAPDNAFKGY